MEIIGVGHGYAAMKTTHYVFPSGVVDYGEHEPYTLQNTLLYNGKYYVCGSGRQPLLRDKMVNNNYYLLTLAALAKEVRYRTGKRIPRNMPLYWITWNCLKESRPLCWQISGDGRWNSCGWTTIFPMQLLAVVWSWV